LAHPDWPPLAIADRSKVAAARDAHRAALLLAAADPVREVGGDADVIELRGGLVVPAAPGLAAIAGDVGALIADQDENRWIAGVDPQILVVVAAGRTAQPRPGLAAVGRLHRDQARDVDHVGVPGIDHRHHQIAAADPHHRSLVAGDPGPRRAGVVGAE